MDKGFKTISQLVELLESRGVATDEDTPGVLRREGYYAVVNGYKGPFLDRNAMQSSPRDVYLPGTSFTQIHDLFLYDRELRGGTLDYLIRAEATMKNAVVYAFCERNPGPDSYLDRANYASAGEMLVPSAYRGSRAEMHGTNMATLMRILNGKLTLRAQTRPFIRHYIVSYGSVPLWVLQNDLTFGNIAHFYQLQRRGVQNAACKAVAEASGNGERIGARDLLWAFDVLVGFRNICAHDERLYCADVKGARYMDMVRCLSTVLPKEEGQGLVEELNALDAKYSGRISSGVLDEVYAAMRITPEASPVQIAGD